MKAKYYLLFFIMSAFFASAQDKEKDNITELLDSLTKLYYFGDIEVSKESKYGFKKGEVPKYEESVYVERIDKLNTNSPFHFTYNPVVRKYIDRYTRNPKSAASILANSKYYFPLYEKYLVQFNIPVELKYLSIVESALNPTAKSHCGAAGLWQFMYGTAKAYKLEINSYVDERFDPEKETIVACRYLKDLYATYGDWPLAIAAYNCGPGNVNKGIKKAGKKDFWAIYNYLPKETQGYVPAFIAACYIMEYHEEHNMQAADPRFIYDDIDFIMINEKTSIAKLSHKYKIDYKVLKYLNPKYYVGVVPGNNDVLIVPKEKALEAIVSEDPTFNQVPVFKSETPVELQVKNDEKTVVKEEPIKVVSSGGTNTGTKKSPFGTIKRNSGFVSNNVDKEENKAFLSEVNNSVSVLSEAYGPQSLVNESYVLFRTTQEITLQDNKIPANSILKGKAFFQGSSIYIKILSFKNSYGEIKINLESEILEAPKKGKYSLEDGYTVIFRS